MIQSNIVVLVPRYPTNNRVLPPGVIYLHFGNYWVATIEQGHLSVLQTSSIEFGLTKHNRKRTCI